MNEYERLQKENYYLKQLLTKMMHNQTMTGTRKIVTKQSPLEEKVRLLKSLFKGRTDVYALRWESESGSKGYIPACELESGKNQSAKGRIFNVNNANIVSYYL